jgi:hypothetical protein
MLLAQLPFEEMLLTWTGVCGAVLACMAMICYLVGRPHPGLLLGLGIGACFMSALAIAAWVRFGPGLLPAFGLPPARWMIVVPARWIIAVPWLSLFVGSWAVTYGVKTLRR